MAWDFRGGALTRRWAFDSNVSGSQYTDQGDHQLAIADVDGDGRDEIVFGAMAIDDNGNPLWNTRHGHGDALHVGDLDPSRPGEEVFKVDENSTAPSSWTADARTGQVLWSTPPNGDNGRGVSDDVWVGTPARSPGPRADPMPCRTPVARPSAAGPARGRRGPHPAVIHSDQLPDGGRNSLWITAPRLVPGQAR